MAKKRPNPADYRFENRTEESLLREPGQISPYDFSINSLDKCVVHLLDKIAQVTVDKVTNSRLHFGPVEGSIFLRDCENCVVTVCCQQFRAKNCKNLYIFLYSESDPSIEYSSSLIFGPYNFSYPLQDTHFIESKLDINHDMWSQVFDFNKGEDEHWRLLRPDEYKIMQWEKDELGQPVNPIPLHAVYGGTLEGDIKVGSQQHGEQGLMSFNFDTSQKDAELHFDYQEVSDTKIVEPAGQQGYIISDDIDFTSPFESQPQEKVNDSSNSFAQAEADTEELERQRLRDLENKERNKKMMDKDEKERLKKDEKRKESREVLKKWYEDRNKQILRQQDLNQEKERLLFEKRKTFPTSWKKVGSMIDSEDRKDVARMKSVLLAKKHEN